MKPKFQIGDKARPNRQVPLWVWNELCRHRTRTIISIGYDEAQQHILYELGIQGNGGFPYLFRAWQLTLVTGKTKHTIGRPRQKRSYTLHSKVLSKPLEQQMPLLTPKQVSTYLETPDLHYRGLLDLQHI